VEAVIVVIIVTAAGFFRSFAGCLPEISEPIGDLSNIPVKILSISADLSGLFYIHIHSNFQGERRTFFNSGRGSLFV
jgi:hypothetical protein